MPTNDAKSLQKLLKLISNENKFKIILHLAKGEGCVCDIGEKLGIEQSLVSHHLNSLRRAKLINDRKIGAWVHCSLNRPVFEKLETLFTQYLSPQNLSDKMCDLHIVRRGGRKEK